MKRIYTALNVAVLLLGLGVINRLVYSKFKEVDFTTIIQYFINLNKSNSDNDIIVLLCILVLFFLWFIVSYIKYNTPFKRAPESFGVQNYKISSKSHSTIFWSVIYYPLMLCPLPDKTYLFIIILVIIWIFTLILLSHTNELVLSPIILIHGYKLFLFEDKDNIDEPFYVLLKNEKESYEVIKIQNNIYKEFTGKK